MALAAGTRLGAYEITGELGAGGMGEVYRATDTKLGRDVAIKTLPGALAQDIDRLARFEREAKLLATLNHAHIAAIYGLDEHDGTLFLAMELVEGETLQDKLKEGPLPVEDALHLTLQIAEALEAAHEKGVVHRDLKPANIMVTGDGRVKVLDFGLAKAFSGDPNEASPAHSPALSMAMTQQGLILGTAGYMSPEQARGKAVDQRADIWAFGCVLYEMLTGQPAFAGEDVPTTLARVLANDANMKAFPASTSPSVRKAIELCLQKAPDKRIADIRDVKLALEGAFETASQKTADEAAVARPLWRRALPVAVGVVVAALATGFGVWSVVRPGAATLARFDITPDGGLTVQADSPSVAVSSDGQSIAYLVGGGAIGARELRLRRLDQLGSTTLHAAGQDVVGISSPFFSPDGTQVGFSVETGSIAFVLKRVPVQGGPAATITKLPSPVEGASWGPDGTIIYGTDDTASGLWRVRATGGKPEMLTKPDPERGIVNHWWPEILPGGKAVLFTMVGASEQDSKIAVLSLATGKQRVLVKGGTSPHYSRTGHLLFSRAGALYAVHFDAARLQVEGNPVPVQQGVMTKANLGATEASLASNGTLVYLSGSQSRAARHLVWVDTEGHETPVPTPPRAYDEVVLSPDGKHAAVTIRGNKAVWIADLKRGTLEPLPAHLGETEPYVLFFSGDGRRVASSAVRDGRHDVVWQRIDGTGTAKPLVTFDASVDRVTAGSLSPDGTRFVPTILHRTKSFDLGLVTIGERESYREFLATPATDADAAISPDGHWIAYYSDDGGTTHVYVERFPQGGGRQAVSIAGGGWPHWSADGSALTYLRVTASKLVAMMRVRVTGLEDPSKSPTFGTPKALFGWKYFNHLEFDSSFDMTADGKRFLMITAGAQGDKAARLVLVQNWSEQLKRLVATK